ncbi:PaaX family transcriptional regulator C-terminal domain-containing protein [Planobispora longispora]|uniref:Putative repressor in the phenylacetic acid catabolism n=1 Tax=Planobispora longispora TaxID=28887 RepID=A0A8J3RS21_9ACTN|nr:PaaX family transcriptional regulator C-terminal domain-containing protein [Planobispora longispora]GIH78837.1 putative repressor in the phenylacetic acid catabolism [Planobispora longispora]
MSGRREEEREDGRGDGGVEVPTRILVEGMVREDGTVDAGELYAVAGALGMTDQQVRLCVKRLVAEGRLTQEGRGRRALLRAADDVRRSIAPNAEFMRHMYRQDRGRAPWDGVWHLAGFAVPEAARSARDALREVIVGLGGAPVHGGLYVSPNDWGELVEAEAGRLGVAGYVTLLTSGDLSVGGERDPRALAARLWPLDRIARAHERLREVAESRLARLRGPEPLPREEVLTIAIELAAEFTRAVEPDPLLPPELLPRPWPGVRARALVARCWEELRRADPAGAPSLFRVYGDVVREIVEGAGEESWPGDASPGRDPG